MKRNAEEPENNLQEKQETLKKKHRQTSIITYIAILFGVAFLLLLLSYFMQQRNTAEVIQGLQSSVSALENIENLQNRNLELEKEVEALQEEEKNLNTQLQIQKENNITQEKRLQAMDLFWQILKLSADGQDSACKAAIEQMETQELVQYLPKENQNNILDKTPAEEYATIKAKYV